jgi:pimeloyl-ACP methyl ester carboxylesterase
VKSFLLDHQKSDEEVRGFSMVKTNNQQDGPGQESGRGINVLLVHGAFADASQWLSVIKLLQAHGYNTLATQNSLASLEEDVNTTRQALASLAGPTVLVGHSYGGAVITNAGTDASHVRSLVYIAAFAPEEGESIMDIEKEFSAPPEAAYIIPSYRKGFDWIDPSAFPENYIQDVSLTETRALAVVQKPTASACFLSPTGRPAWKHIPSWYLVSSNDRAIQPETERFMAKRIGATTREMAVLQKFLNSSNRWIH